MDKLSIADERERREGAGVATQHQPSIAWLPIVQWSDCLLLFTFVYFLIPGEHRCCVGGRRFVTEYAADKRRAAK